MARIQLGERRHEDASKEALTLRRKATNNEQHFFEQEKGELYGPGIAEYKYEKLNFITKKLTVKTLNVFQLKEK